MGIERFLIYIFPRFDFLSHQHRERLIRFDRVFHGDLQRRSRSGIHGGFVELLGIHLAETLEATDHGLLAVRTLDCGKTLVLVEAIHPVLRFLTQLDDVEG